MCRLKSETIEDDWRVRVIEVPLTQLRGWLPGLLVCPHSSFVRGTGATAEC